MTTAVDIIFITPVGPIVRQVKDGDYATPARALATDLEAAEAEVAPVAMLREGHGAENQPAFPNLVRGA